MSASRKFYGKINRGQVSRPLYGGCPLFGGSAIRGFTVPELMVSRTGWGSAHCPVCTRCSPPWSGGSENVGTRVTPLARRRVGRPAPANRLVTTPPGARSARAPTRRPIRRAHPGLAPGARGNFFGERPTAARHPIWENGTSV